MNPQQPSSTLEEHASHVHAASLVINGLAQGGSSVYATVAAAAEGGVTAMNLTVAANDTFRSAAQKLCNVRRALDSLPESLTARIITEASEIDECKAAGSVGIIVGFQNADPIEDCLAYLEMFRLAGLRILQLTYQRTNLLGSGCGEKVDEGLTAFGREVVAECNRLGILVDVSHVGPRTTLDAIDCSQVPVAITHANLASFNPIPRNKTDDIIRAIGKCDGMIGITAISRLIRPDGSVRGATVVDYADQIEAVADLIGYERVGMGLDIYEGMTPEVFEGRKRSFFVQFPELAMGGDFELDTYFVSGLASAADVRSVTAELLLRGWKRMEIEAVMGGNWRRMLERSWQPRDRAVTVTVQPV